MSKNKKFYSILIYTVMFAVSVCIVFYPMYKSGKSLVWVANAGDGLSQHFNSLVYWGEYLRSFFGNLLEGDLSLPMWDMSLGYGGDILSTLNYYAIGDPLNLIYAFVSGENTEYLYDFMIIFRMYLAGLFFMSYCFYMKKNHRASVFGALIYVFTGFTIFSGIRHPFFLNPLIYLPLLLIGVEKIFKKEKPYFFVFTVCISAMSNYYFLYMLTIFIFLYALIRFFSYIHEKYLSNFFRTLARFSGYYILGIGLSAVILLPAVIGFMGNARGSETVSVGIFYPLRYYSRILLNFFGFENTGSSAFLSFIPVAGVAVLLLFVKKNKDRKYTALKTGLILALIFLSFKVFGYVFNGFAYVTNRWSLVIGFIVAFTFVEMYPSMFSMTNRERWLVGSVIILLGVYSIGAQRIIGRGFYPFGSNSAVIIIAISFVCICFVQKMENIYKSVISSIMIGLLIFISLAIHSYYRFDDEKGMYTSEFMDAGNVYESLEDDSVKLLKSVKDSELFRVNTNSGLNHNYGLTSGLKSLNNYFSVSSGDIGNTLNGFQTLDLTYLFKYKGVDDRIGLYGLNGVKYIVVGKDNNTQKSWKKRGFEIVEENGDMILLKNKYALPFGYTYDSYIMADEYQKLNGVEKEQTMLRSIVLNEREERLQNHRSNISVKNRSINLKKRSVKINRANTKLRLSLDTVPGEDSYLYFKGLKFEDNRKRKSTYFVRVSSEGWSQSLKIQQKGNSQFFGREDFVLHLGELKDKTIDFTFFERGEYKVDELKILTVSEKETLEQLKRLKDNGVMENVSYKNNRFSGTIQANKNSMLCIPIPYSSGWKAEDNGEEVQVKKVNGMYMGWMLSPGKHEIKMTYRTPGIVPGAIISVFSAGILLILRKKDRF